jgi:hypothetical protein
MVSNRLLRNSLGARWLEPSGLLRLWFAASLVGLSSPAAAQVVSGSYVGNDAGGRKITGLGFRPDVVLVKGNDYDAGNPGNTSAVVRTSTMSGDASKPMVLDNALAANQITSLDADGFTLGSDRRVAANGITFYWAAFKANADTKVGTYVGTGVGTRSVSGVGFSPDFLIVLPSNAARAIQACSVTPAGRAYEFDIGAWLPSQITSLDADGFTVNHNATAPYANASGVVYHYVAWNEAPGLVKVGSYQGNGIDTRAINGIGFRPEFLFAKFIYNLGSTPSQSPPGLFRTTAMPYDNSYDYGRSVATNHLEDFLPDGFQIGNAVTINRTYTDCSIDGPGCEYFYVAINNLAVPPLATVQTPTTITVTAPDSFEMTFSTASGGGIETFYDLGEDPTRTFDLAGSLAGDVPTLHNARLGVGGIFYDSARNDAGARVALLEATRTRVRVRSESFYQSSALGPLAGVKGFGDYSIYPSGRCLRRPAAPRRIPAPTTSCSPRARSRGHGPTLSSSSTRTGPSPTAIWARRT